MTVQSITPLIGVILSVLQGSVRISTPDGQDKPSQTTIVTFQEQIAPLLSRHCAPCHFKGGTVYEEYPFDKYETARDLGKRLNSRLKGENSDLVTRWIENGSPNKKEDKAKKP